MGRTPSRRAIGDAFAGRRNSLNFLRLLFAIAVIASHAIPIGQFGTEALNDRVTLGTVGVLGFFAISGYLVAQSADRNSVGGYLWRRFLRIFPGFWVCLIVMVALFGTIGWVQASHHPRGCGLTCWWANEGVTYVTHNFFLRINHPYLAGTKTWLGLPLSNNPLWTLFYEFVCYLILAALSLTRLLRKIPVVFALTVAVWTLLVAVALTQRQWDYAFDIDALLALVPVFLTGTLVYLCRDSIPDSGWLALLLALAAVASCYLPIGRTQFGSLTNFVTAESSVTIFAPALVYPVLWLGMHLPFHKVGARNDYSYGFYIYAFPVQRLLAIWNVQRFGYVVYLAACLAMTAPLAIASWWFVERHALRLKRLNPSAVSRRLSRPPQPMPRP